MQRSYTLKDKTLKTTIKEPARQEASKSPLQRKFDAFKKRYKVQ